MQTEGSRQRNWLLLLVPIGIIIIVIAAVVASRQLVLAVPDQPIAYSHKKHVDAGVQCLYCHSSALRSPVAGIPSVQQCMGCHDVVATETEAVERLAGYWEREEPIPWRRVNRLADFVYFSHQPHLGAGLNCETCHGDVGEMDVARPVVNMDMGWCLECHLEQPAEKVERLTDCLACHK